jgi:hypothetical protein
MMMIAIYIGDEVHINHKSTMYDHDPRGWRKKRVHARTAPEVQYRIHDLCKDEQMIPCNSARLYRSHNIYIYSRSSEHSQISQRIKEQLQEE